MAPLLQTVNLQKHFRVKEGFLHAVDGINLEIEKGETLGVVGESGCGKSTLGRVILQLLPPTGGEIYFEGRDMRAIGRQEKRERSRDMQIIFQDPFSSLDPRMTVFQLIEEPLVVSKAYSSSRERALQVIAMMDTVGLARRYINAYPHELDGGRRQRIGVARALALSPKFVVCDEPVSALDVSIQAQILNLLMDLQDELGLTYLFITHDLSVVKHISQQMMVMYLGKCVEKASSRELFKNPMHPYTKALLAAIPKPSLRARLEQNIIRGEVSNPINPKPGCRFAPRCDYCTDACGRDVELREQGEGHYVACTLYK